MKHKRTSYLAWTEDILAEREEARNKKITRALAGKMKPGDEYIMKRLKEKSIEQGNKSGRRL